MDLVVRLVSTLVLMSLLGPAPRVPVPPLKPLHDIDPLPLKTVEEIFGGERHARTARLEEWDLLVPIFELADWVTLPRAPTVSPAPVPRFSPPPPGPLKSWEEILAADPG